jgi:dolichyl-phosphate beta-glucosyltransferase
VVAVAHRATGNLRVTRRAPFGVRHEPAGRPAPSGDLRLSVVVPAYNEGQVIGRTVSTIRAELAELDGGVEVVVVDDGSSDDTSEAAASAGADQVITLDHNSGKGAAVRSGALAAKGRTVVFTDADLAYAPDQIPPLLELVESGWDVVVGSRYADGSTAEVPASLLRRVGGRVINLLVRLVLRGDHADTQCGLKAFRRDVAALLFGEASVDGFAFDVELFALAERHRLSLLESPVRVVNSTSSSVRLTRDTAVLVLDLLRISWRLRRGGYPDPDPTALPPGVVGDGS